MLPHRFLSFSLPLKPGFFLSSDVPTDEASPLCLSGEGSLEFFRFSQPMTGLLPHVALLLREVFASPNATASLFIFSTGLAYPNNVSLSQAQIYVHLAR